MKNLSKQGCGTNTCIQVAKNPRFDILDADVNKRSMVNHRSILLIGLFVLLEGKCKQTGTSYVIVGSSFDLNMQIML